MVPPVTTDLHRSLWSVCGRRCDWPGWCDVSSAPGSGVCCTHSRLSRAKKAGALDPEREQRRGRQAARAPGSSCPGLPAASDFRRQTPQIKPNTTILPPKPTRRALPRHPPAHSIKSPSSCPFIPSLITNLHFCHLKTNKTPSSSPSCCSLSSLLRSPERCCFSSPQFLTSGSSCLVYQHHAMEAACHRLP